MIALLIFLSLLALTCGFVFLVVLLQLRDDYRNHHRRHRRTR